MHSPDDTTSYHFQTVNDNNVHITLTNRQEDNVYDANEKARWFAGITHDRIPREKKELANYAKEQSQKIKSI